jgi:hypothetical protein
MYLIAFRRRVSLNLTKTEIFDTKSNIYVNLLMGAIPFCSALLAWFEVGGGNTNTFSLSGMFYMLYALVMPVFGSIRRKRRDKLFPEDIPVS